MNKYLEIYKFGQEVPVKRMDVTGRNDKYIDLADAGANRNLNHEQYYTMVTESEVPLPLEPLNQQPNIT